MTVKSRRLSLSKKMISVQNVSFLKHFSRKLRIVASFKILLTLLKLKKAWISRKSSGSKAKRNSDYSESPS